MTASDILTAVNAGIHETKQGFRYAVSEPARREVLARSHKLNHESQAEKVKRGLREKKKVKEAKKTKKTESDEPGLY